MPSTTPSISATDAISKAESELCGTYTGHPTKIEFVAKQDGSVALTHLVQVRDYSKAMWYEAFVDSHTSDIVQLTDPAAHAPVGPVLCCDPDRPYRGHALTSIQYSTVFFPSPNRTSCKDSRH